MIETINIMRHESVFNPTEHNYPIHIIGAGATGSRVFAALVELGMKQIHVYDPDIIEDHNLANQIYMADDIGRKKVEGCRRFTIRKLGTTPSTITYNDTKVSKSYFDAGHLCGGIVFILTDTMKSRSTIFQKLAERCDYALDNPNNDQAADAPLLIIETRMGSTHGAVYTVNPFDKKQRTQWYETLVDDEDPDNIELSPCGTTLSVGTTASLIANYAVWQMMQFFVDPVGLQPKLEFFFKPTLTIPSPSIAA